MNTATWDLILSTLREEEGLRLKPYRDTVGVWTVGYGHNLEQKPLRREACDLVLEHDASDAIAEAREAIPEFDRLTAARQVALVSMAFQMGGASLKRFLTMRAHIAAGRYADAAKAMLNSRWARQTPARAERMARLMEQG